MKAKVDYENMTNEEILKLFKKQYERLKPTDSTEYIKKCNTPSLYILKKRLNLTWNSALKEIGIHEKRFKIYKN